MRAERRRLGADSGRVEAVLAAGAAKVQPIAAETMRQSGGDTGPGR